MSQYMGKSNILFIFGLVSVGVRVGVKHTHQQNNNKRKMTKVTQLLKSEPIEHCKIEIDDNTNLLIYNLIIMLPT